MPHKGGKCFYLGISNQFEKIARSLPEPAYFPRFSSGMFDSAFIFLLGDQVKPPKVSQLLMSG